MGEIGLSVGRKLRYGMIGGGPGAFIGAVHRRAVELDGDAELVAGAFSSDPDKSKEQGKKLLLAQDRVYESYHEMVEREAKRPDAERVDFVIIVTPNHLHHPVAKAFLENGFFVVCDKPLTTTVSDAKELATSVNRHGSVFGVTYNYSGYPLVKQAREMVRSGELGDVRKILVEYTQGWLTTALESTGQKQAAWRTDPDQSGTALALGDIGSHAEHLTRYVTGLDLESVFADLTSFVPGRKLEDDANVLMRLTGGARGVLTASQIACGEENNLALRVYGSRSSLSWRQEAPNYLVVKPYGKPPQRLGRGNEYLCAAAQRNTRLPSGHPEGYLEAFANVYANILHTIDHRLSGTEPGELDLDFPTVHDGEIGVRFIRSALESGRDGLWVDL